MYVYIMYVCMYVRMYEYVCEIAPKFAVWNC